MFDYAPLTFLSGTLNIIYQFLLKDRDRIINLLYLRYVENQKNFQTQNKTHLSDNNNNLSLTKI